MARPLMKTLFPAPRVLPRALALGLGIAMFIAAVPLTTRPVLAAEMDKKAKADAKDAMRLYKEGSYEDAAKIFVRLSIAYPDMLVFVRNLGACYYYMRRYEPALSNLRDYEHRKKDMAPDDRAEVAGWIGEMERMRDQAASASAVSSPAPVVAPLAPPVPVAVPVPSAPEPAVAASSSSAQPPSGQASPATATATQGPYGAEPQPPYAQGAYGAQPQPAYPQGAYPQGTYGAQPGYPPGPYGSPTTYPPGAPYPPGTYQPAGVAAPANPPQAAGGAGGGRKAAAWILGIVGVGGIAAGGFFTALTLDRFHKVQTKYDPAVEKEGKKFAVLQWVCYGSGAALLTTAIIVGSGGGSQPRVALAPAVGPGLAGASLSGSF